MALPVQFINVVCPTCGRVNSVNAKVSEDFSTESDGTMKYWGAEDGRNINCVYCNVEMKRGDKTLLFDTPVNKKLVMRTPPPQYISQPLDDMKRDGTKGTIRSLYNG